jgi:Family of unknown function (DUF6069)
MGSEWYFSPEQERPPDRRVNATRLWIGGAATALVAALVALAGVVIARGVFAVPLLAPAGDAWGDASTAGYLVAAAGGALLATGLLHGLLFTPRPFVFFGWTMALAIAVASLAPFASTGSMDTRVATGLLNLAIGIAIWSLLAGTGRSSVVMPPTTPTTWGGPYGRSTG